MENLEQEAWLEGAKQEEAVIIDVRTAAEIEEGIVPGALHLDIFDAERFMNEIVKMDSSKSYYVYCRSGNRSGQACAFMDKKGFSKTYNLIGGMMEFTGELASS